MTWQRGFGWLLALVASTFSARLRAEVLPVPVHLSYAAPPTCPSAEALRERVSELTPRVVWVGGAQAQKKFVIRLALDARGARGVLSMRAASRDSLERQLQAATCDELSEAMAIIVALILDPEANLDRPHRPAPRPASVLAKPPAPAPRPRPVTARVNPELFVVGGPTPNPTVGGALGVSLLFLQKSPFELGVRASARSSLAQDFATDYGGTSFTWRALSLELCPLGSPTRRLLRAEGCASFDAGQIVASAETNPGADTKRTWLAPGAAVHAGFYAWDILGLEATLAASLPLIRDRFLLTPFPIHQPAVVAWRTGLALSVRFF